jgi:hypothetical protein
MVWFGARDHLRVTHANGWRRAPSLARRPGRAAVVAPVTLTAGLSPKEIEVPAKAHDKRDDADDDQRTANYDGQQASDQAAYAQDRQRATPPRQRVRPGGGKRAASDHVWVLCGAACVTLRPTGVDSHCCLPAHKQDDGDRRRRSELTFVSTDRRARAAIATEYAPAALATGYRSAWPFHAGPGRLSRRTGPPWWQ